MKTAVTFFVNQFFISSAGWIASPRKQGYGMDDFEHLRHFQICRSRPETIAPKV